METEKQTFMKKENEFKIQIPLLKDKKVFKLWRKSLLDYLGTQELTQYLQYENFRYVYADFKKPIQEADGVPVTVQAFDKIDQRDIVEQEQL